LFCGIAGGKIPAQVIRRGDGLLAFRDINPQAPTHFLVIPARHVTSLNEADDTTLLGRLLAFAREVAAAEGLAERGFRVVINTNADGGQTVFHLHAHVLGGRRMTWPPG
jgi:histidine triad (HIT) family protein